METRVLQVLSSQPSAAEVGPAVEELRRGEVVGLPTETVYGLAGVATNVEAVTKIFSAKERPTFDPLIVHVPPGDWAPIAELTADLSAAQYETAFDLWRTFFPGPLTLLLPKNVAVIPDLVTSGSPWVALRSPSHPVFQAILRELGQPLAAPSANRFGRISPTSAQHVLTELGGRIPLIVDGGPCAHGVESTILRIDENGEGTILRQGPVTEETLRSLIQMSAALSQIARPGELQAPGTLESHYAPRTRLRLIADATDLPQCGRERVGYLGWGDESLESYWGLGAVGLLCKSQGDWTTAAQNLFRLLRELDEAALDTIYARAVPEVGLGRAIMDRLSRAAARRPD